MKKKVLHISNYYTPHIGGIENTCQYLAEGVEAYDCCVICFSEDAKTKIERINNIMVYKAGVNLNIARQAISFSYLKLLKKVLNEFKPDIIHFHAPNPFVNAILLLLYKREIKLLVHWHLDITKQKYIYPFIKPVENWLLKKTSIIVCTSPRYRDNSEPLKPYYEKTEILPSAIDPERFKLTDKDKELLSQLKEKYKNSKIVLYIGRHVPHKGLEDLLKAEKHIAEDCRILIGGTGAMTSELQKKYHSTRIHFLGRLSNNDIKLYYHLADIFAFPSYTKAEAFGLTLCEAMYCKTPTVVYSIKGSGVNWVTINNNTGIEVENRNIKEYANAIDLLLKDDKLRVTYAENAFCRVKELFTLEKEIQECERIYNKILKAN